MGLGQQRQIHSKAFVGRFGPGDGLEHQIHRNPASHQFQRGGDVGQHTGLGGDFMAVNDVVQHMQ